MKHRFLFFLRSAALFLSSPGWICAQTGPVAETGELESATAPIIVQMSEIWLGDIIYSTPRTRVIGRGGRPIVNAVNRHGMVFFFFDQKTEAEAKAMELDGVWNKRHVCIMNGRQLIAEGKLRGIHKSAGDVRWQLSFEFETDASAQAGINAIRALKNKPPIPLRP